MILSIESSINTFKTIHFHEGLNVLLADTTPKATSGQTRNSSGKTSLIEIIHFLYGADCKPDSIFRTDALIEQTFIGTIVINGKTLKVERGGAVPSRIFILEGGREQEDLLLKTDNTSGRLFVSNVNWRAFLGHTMFGLPANLQGTSFDQSFTPSFRSMFSYFVRRHNSGAFFDPVHQAKQQQPWNWQVNLTYLLGLDWKIPFEFEKVRARERAIKELKKAASSETLGRVVGTVAQLRPQVTIAGTKAQNLRAQLTNFEVLDSYKDLSQRAAKAKGTMQSLSRQGVSLQVTLDHLQRALEDETSPGHTELQQMYSNVGIELPGVALRRFEEVEAFHASVVKNRQIHLQQEITEVNRQISECQSKVSDLDIERREIMKTLEGRGALDDFIRLQKELAELEVEAASLRERFKTAEMLEGESTQLDLDRTHLKARLQRDHRERKVTLDMTILTIADAVDELYDDRSGEFVVSATNSGPQYRVSIEGDRGGGISSIEIFCMDLALFKQVSSRYGGLRFLIHDSHLFDGVDERQIARALLLGKQATEGKGLQYIVTMNSDIFNRLPFLDQINPKKVVLPTRLSDATEIGGLFGFRFE